MNELISEIPFVAGIHSEEEYLKACNFLQELVKSGEYSNHETLLDILAAHIEIWELRKLRGNDVKR